MINELIGLTFNDQDGPSNNILWSSSKIVNLIPKGQFQAKQPNAVSGNFAKFGDENNSGQTIDSGILLDDNADPSSSVIWSSEKIAKIPLPPFQLKQPDAISGNISIFGSDVNLGQVIDSGYSINDSLPPSSQVIWSSNQVQSQLLAVSQAKQPNANAGNLAIFGNGVNMVKLLIQDIQLMICLHLLLMFCIQVVKFHKFFNHKCLFFQVYLLHLQLILRLIFICWC